MRYRHTKVHFPPPTVGQGSTISLLKKEHVHVPKAQAATTVSVNFYPYFMYLSFERELYIGFESSVGLFARNRHAHMSVSAIRLSHFFVRNP